MNRELLEHDGAFDSIQADPMMPRLGGPELCQRLRATKDERNGLWLVSLSAGMMPDDPALYRASGFDEVVGKPIDRTELDNELRARNTVIAGGREA